MNSIANHTCKGVPLFSFQNIVRLHRKSNYSKIYFTDKRYPLTVASVLLWFEENLPTDIFFRIHRKHLFNKFAVGPNNILGKWQNGNTATL